MATPAVVAAILLLGALPVMVWAGLSDLRRMKIPNRAVLALAGVFALGGLGLAAGGLWPWSEYGWRWANLAAVLLAGMGLNALGMIGAGDAKLAAAAAPFVAFADWPELLGLYAAAVLAAFALHRLAKYTVGPRLAPHWKSWDSGKRFPMGVAIGLTVVGYLGLAAAA
ncbi:prepilin peptidase [Rubellimicrobium sp. CFH 75288]|uniref:prepilin peptidase n=1 Tax=Rubellimicrobium sp. CFH 75288 TaxID=2697034 RepID=UPI0014126A36|nr:prepilin peptidase [Rubellimicrobium sp. CFH 75288]NAZ35630.1 hypothetical protein [Rubellimicrobium sp. CFH 75288]